MARRTPPLLLAMLAAAAPAAAAVDVAALWDFSDPAASEQRMRAALATAQGDHALILQTQIARSYGLRRQFDRAREVLAAIEPQLAAAGAEARARHALELGRSFASATHDAITPQAAEAARAAFERALAIARDAGLDALAIDAIHMFAFIDTAPQQQRERAEQALALVLASRQPAARRWEASVRHNLGYALLQLDRLDEALVQFNAALALREAGSNPGATRVARWMVARTLRGLGRGDEALAMQLALEREHDAAGSADRHVYEELQALYRQRGDDTRERHYAERAKALR